MIDKKYLLSAIIVLSFLVVDANAQSVFIKKSGNSGVAASAGLSSGGGFSGPILGASYSANGKLDVAVGYSSLKNNDVTLTGFSIGASFFAARQYIKDDPVNMDISPTFSRSQTEQGYETTVALGLGLSRNISSDPDFYIIPGARFSYGIQVQRNESLSLLSFSLDMGFKLVDEILLTISPGVSANLFQKGETGFVSVGVLLL